MTQADLIALARINETIKRLQSLLWQVFDSAEIRPYTRKSRTNPKWLNPDYYGLAVQADVAAPTAASWIEDHDVGWTRCAAIKAGSEHDRPAVPEVGVWTDGLIDVGDEKRHAWPSAQSG